MALIDVRAEVPMSKIKIATATPDQLNWLVAQRTGEKVGINRGGKVYGFTSWGDGGAAYNPARSILHAEKVIDKLLLSLLRRDDGSFTATCGKLGQYLGVGHDQDKLLAIMRAVAATLSDDGGITCEVPDELIRKKETA